MEREVVSGAGLPPRSVSHAVRAGGFVFVSGQPGVDPETESRPDPRSANKRAIASTISTPSSGSPAAGLISIGCTGVVDQ